MTLRTPVLGRQVAATAPADRAARALSWVMGGLLVGLVILLYMPGDFGSSLEGAFSVVAVLFPLVVCMWALWRSRSRRREVLFATGAVAAFSLANMYYAAAQAVVGTVPVPSPADVGYTLFYPLMLGALAVLVRRQGRGLGRSVWLDSAFGSLGAASVLAVLLNPVFDAAAAGPPSAASVVSVAMPILDLVLVATVVGIAAAPGLDIGRRWLLLVLGLLIFAATDVTFALLVAHGTYEYGTPLNAGWAVGLALVAVWVIGRCRSEATAGARGRPWQGPDGPRPGNSSGSGRPGAGHAAARVRSRGRCWRR